MQLFAPLLWRLLGNTVSPGDQQWSKSTSHCTTLPVMGLLFWTDHRAPFNCLSITLKSVGRLCTPAGIKSLSALAPIQAEVQKVNYKTNKKRESKWEAEPFNLEGWNHCGSWGGICCEFRNNQDPFLRPRVSPSLVQSTRSFSSHLCHGNHYIFSYITIGYLCSDGLWVCCVGHCRKADQEDWPCSVKR